MRRRIVSKGDNQDAIKDSKLPSSSSPRFQLTRRTQALILLTLQNASVSLLTRYSRTHSVYDPSTAVLSTEIVKTSISLYMLTRGNHNDKEGSTSRRMSEAVQSLFGSQKMEMLNLAVPAALYALQNTLLYTALSNLTAEIYQTTYQLKLLTTAIFSILFFKTPISRQKWIALFILTLGVAIVQLEPSSFSSNSSSSSPSKTISSTSKNLTSTLKRKEESPLESTKLSQHDDEGRSSIDGQDAKKGFGAIFLACVSSGLAGAWFEKVLKKDPSSSSTSPSTTRTMSTKENQDKLDEKIQRSSPSLWQRNLQLAVPSLFFALLGVYLSSSSSSSPPIVFVNNGGGGIFETLERITSLWNGFSPIVWLVVLNQAAGGLLVALVVREASSIDKGFATSLAIVISTLFSSILSNTIPSGFFVTGAGLVISSTVLYSLA